VYAFIGDVGLLREEVVKMQVKVASGSTSTSILLWAIKSSLRVRVGELIGDDVTANISFMAGRIILQISKGKF
jgi:hypothetical protein